MHFQFQLALKLYTLQFLLYSQYMLFSFYFILVICTSAYQRVKYLVFCIMDCILTPYFHSDYETFSQSIHILILGWRWRRMIPKQRNIEGRRHWVRDHTASLVQQQFRRRQITVSYLQTLCTVVQIEMEEGEMQDGCLWGLLSTKLRLYFKITIFSGKFFSVM